MDAWVWVVIAVAILVVVGALAWAMSSRRRSGHLQERFGPEYERAVDGSDRRSAERELRERQRRRAELDIRPLSPEARQRYADEWARVQIHFVDGPAEALGEADRLTLQVMRDRGYPMDEFEQRAADLSVDHPDVVEHYRAAHAITVEIERGADDTERMRQGFMHYRALFAELLGAEAVSTTDRS